MIDFELFVDANARDLNEIIQLYVTSFLLWKRKTSYRRAQSVANALPVWWILRGPTGFKSAADAQRFKLMLLSAAEQAEARAVDVPEAPEPTEDASE